MYSMYLPKRNPTRAYLSGVEDVNLSHTNIFIEDLASHTRRKIIIDGSMLADMVSDIRRLLGSVGDMLLYYQGFSVGKYIYQNLRGSHTHDYNVAINHLVNTFRQYGWGIVNVDSKSNPRASSLIVRIYENVECLLAPKRSKPNSQLARGVLAGFFSSLFNTKVYVEEKKCIAMGDPYCEFILLFDT